MKILHIHRIVCLYALYAEGELRTDSVWHHRRSGSFAAAAATAAAKVSIECVCLCEDECVSVNDNEDDEVARRCRRCSTVGRCVLIKYLRTPDSTVARTERDRDRHRPSGALSVCISRKYCTDIVVIVS